MSYSRKGETTSYITDTIMEQINWKTLRLNGFEFVRLSNIALRVYKGNKNLDICYNEGSDLYDLKKHTIQPDLTTKTQQVDEIYCDQLADIIAEFFNIKDANYRNNFGSYSDGDIVTCVICGKPIRKSCATLVGGTRVNGPVHKKCLVSKLVEDAT